MLKFILKKQRLLLLIAVWAATPAFAQFDDEQVAVQQPLAKLRASFYPEPKMMHGTVKSFTYVQDKDTLVKSIFDQAHQETIHFDYIKNRPLSKAVYTYTAALKTEKQSFYNDVLQNRVTYGYDKHGREQEWKVVRYLRDKTSGKTTQQFDKHWFAEWNANNRLEATYRIDAAGKRELYARYIYDGQGRLSEINELQWKTVFSYDNRMLTHKSKLFKNGNTVSYAAAYEYFENGLLRRSSDDYNTVSYVYTDSILQSMRTVKKGQSDSLWQEANFHYDGDLLQSVEISSNSVNMNFATIEFIFLSDYLYSWQPKQVNKIGMAFTYDRYKNITEIRYSLNGAYKYSKWFLYEYY